MIEHGYTIEQYLAENGEYMATTAGVSMFPLLRDREYAVKIIPAAGRLKKYDVALFRRGRQCVLHRVIKVLTNGYFIRGDNCEDGEFVADDQIVGILSEIIGEKKHIKTTDRSYRFYSRMTVLFFPLLKITKKAARFARRVYRRIFKK